MDGTEIKIAEIIPGIIGQAFPDDAREVPQEERDALLAIAMEEMPKGDTVGDAWGEIPFRHPGRPGVDVRLFRRGSALAVIYGQGGRVVAASAFLAGRVPADDLAIVAELEGLEAVAVDAGTFNKIRAANRPRVHVIYADVEACAQRDVDAIALALSAAAMAAPGAKPKTVEERPATPAEREKREAEFATVAAAYKAVHNDAAEHQAWRYSVKASRRISGHCTSATHEIPVTLTVGAASFTMTMRELACVFIMLRNNSEQLVGAENLKQAQTSGVIDLEPSNGEIADALANVVIKEPDK